MGQRLYSSNIKKYVQETYGEIETQSGESVLTMVPFLQRTFEGESDCTLTSILTICKYYQKQINNLECYNFIKSIAKKYFYSDNFGTIPIFINNIVKPVFKKYNINLKPKSKYFKNIGWNINDIIKNVQNNNPIILSIYTDGRDYYKNHTVVCKGYLIFITKDGKKHYMLDLLDNWNYTSSYLDYEKLGIMSSINLFSN